MPQPSILLLLQIVLSLTIPAYAVDNPMLTSCSVDKFSSPSPYASSLRHLLSKLTKSVPISPKFFSTASVGSPPASQIFGLAQCRPDATAGYCTDCLNLASATAIANDSGGCGKSKSAALRYEYCYLRYSDQKFFGVVDESLAVIIYNVMNSSNLVVFNDQLQKLLADILPKASSSRSRFAVGKRTIEERQDIYGLAWCSMDLAATDCFSCLSSAQSLLLTWKIGGRTVYPSCYIRYEVYVFFSLDMTSSTPGAPPTPTTVRDGINGTAGGGGIVTSRETIVSPAI